jgi:hypothetical protein
MAKTSQNKRQIAGIAAYRQVVVPQVSPEGSTDSPANSTRLLQSGQTAFAQRFAELPFSAVNGLNIRIAFSRLPTGKICRSRKLCRLGSPCRHGKKVAHDVAVYDDLRQDAEPVEHAISNGARIA